MQNFVQCGDFINVACSHPTTPASGNPVRIGAFCGVAATAESEGGNATGNTTVSTEGVFNLSVAAIDSSGALGVDANVALAVGDIVYYGDANSPVLSKRAGGTFFGYALGAVDAGATGTVPVMLAN